MALTCASTPPGANPEDMSAEEHRAHAGKHQGQAECGDFPPDTRKVCPLLGQVGSSENIEGGVRIVLVEGANAEAVKAHVRCHLTSAAKQGFKGMTSAHST